MYFIDFKRGMLNFCLCISFSFSVQTDSTNRHKNNNEVYVYVHNFLNISFYHIIEYSNGNISFSLKLLITNKETINIHLNQIKISFVGQQVPSDSVIPVDVNISPNATVDWHFDKTKNIILQIPFPSLVKIGLFFDNFNTRKIIERVLLRYEWPIPGSYYFPAKIDDLNNGEYWIGTSATHGPAGDGRSIICT